MAHWDVAVPPETQRALEALSLLSGKWQPVVLAVLLHRKKAGFNDLLDAIPGISGKVLTATLDTLQETGLVKRRVLTDSPLRVEYELTEAGERVQGVFDELATWDDQYLESTLPAVLVAENDRRITEMYSEWLADRYRVLCAHDSDELEPLLEEEVNVLVVGQDMTGIDPSDITHRVASDCRTIVLVDGRPGFDVLDIECDDVLCKPLVRERVLEALDQQLSRYGESANQRELAALVTKRDRLGQFYSSEELAARDRYVDVCSRIETLEAMLSSE